MPEFWSVDERYSLELRIEAFRLAILALAPDFQVQVRAGCPLTGLADIADQISGCQLLAFFDAALLHLREAQLGAVLEQDIDNIPVPLLGAAIFYGRIGGRIDWRPLRCGDVYPLVKMQFSCRWMRALAPLAGDFGIV